MAALQAATPTRPHTASSTAQETNFPPSQAIAAATRTVVTVLPGEENRLARNQPIARAPGVR